MFQRRRARILLAVSVVVVLVLVTVDFRSEAGGDDLGGRLRNGVSVVLGPVQDGLSTLVRPIANAAGNVGELFSIRAENARLRAQLAQVEERRLSYDDVVRENEELRAQLDFRQRNELETVSAHVTAQGASNFEWTATIDVGTDDGIRPDMPVTDGDGLVGRVIATASNSSRVLLSIDPNFGASVRIAETGVIGSLQGDGNEPMIFEPLITDVEIEVGQEIVTSAYQGGTFVSGIPVGVVTSAEVEDGQLSRTVDVLPYVNFSTLDIVSVVLTEPAAPDEPLELDPSPSFSPPPVDPQRSEAEVPTIPPPVDDADGAGESTEPDAPTPTDGQDT
ncbi:rod shape-determining protein MreC [Salsipaludibacter albus]|uniref:rod shape-determining protein MreC n=1 Tax=Salsipaludibacter albus TaxID=2849650 RepID=UPI001EE3BE2A|nr:rod shape-determining protein MreC [Salsipaludibacter albus]